MLSILPRKPYVSLILCGGLLVASTAGAQETGKKTMKDSAMARPAVARAAMAKDTISAHGTFLATAGHKAAGSFQIIKVGGHQRLILSHDFSVENKPDVYVVLSRTARAPDTQAVYLGKVTKFKGAQTFVIPTGTEPAAFTQVVLWSKKLNTSLGAAELATGPAVSHHAVMKKDEMKKKDELKKN